MFKLKDYQKTALLKIKNGSILAGNTGSGKSLVSICYYFILCGGKILDNKLEDMTQPLDLYIITTAKKRDDKEWEKELSHLLINKDKNYSKYKINVVIDSWENIKKYSEVKNSFFIFDEQRLVNYGVWAKSFLKISKFNKWILLSATPGEKWEDYAVVFIANGFYKGITDFKMKHLVYNSYLPYPKVERYIEEGLLERHRNEILIPMIKPKTKMYHINEITCNYDVKKYYEVVKKRWNPFTNAPILNSSEYCTTLRRIVNSDESRLKEIKIILKEHPRLIIFYNYDFELEILRTLKNEGYNLAEWNGHKHESIPDTNKWVYLVNYTGGSEAWNCIITDAMCFYSWSYSWKKNEQAKGRIDRIDSLYDDLYYYMLTSDSKIDVKIANSLKNKQDFNEKAFDFQRF